MGVAEGTAAPIGEPLNSALLVAIEDLVAGLAGNPELPAEFAHCLAGELQTADVHPLPNTPSKAFTPPQKGKKCNPCVRYDLSPMSRVAQKSLTLFRKNSPVRSQSAIFRRDWIPFLTTMMVKDLDPDGLSLSPLSVRFGLRRD